MKDRPLLEAVVFDAGGTLVRLDFEWISQMLAELGVAADAQALRRAEIAGRLCFDAASMAPAAGDGVAPGGGTPAPVQAYWGGMLAAAGCPPERLDAALERMDARQASDHFLWARPMEGAREAMDALVRMRLRLGCVSNSDGRAEQHLVRYGVREGLEFVIDSSVVGMQKPDPGIFHLALERLGVPAGRVLYVGDLRSVDEQGSRAAGMPFVLLDPDGTYAGQDTGSVAEIAGLPGYVEDHFTLPPVPERRRH